MDNKQVHIEGGLDILRREARYGKPKTWKHHSMLMRRAREHILLCGGVWEDYADALSRNFAELMRL